MIMKIEILHIVKYVSYNKLQRCLSVLILSCFLCSCDIGYMQTFEGYNSTIVKLHNSERTTRVSCMYFYGSYYLNYGIMKGECTVNYDSLKLQTNDDKESTSKCNITDNI